MHEDDHRRASLTNRVAQLVEEALAAAGEQQRSLAAETAAFRRDAAAALARREAASAVLRRLEAEGAMVNASARALRDKQGGLQVGCCMNVAAYTQFH